MEKVILKVGDAFQQSWEGCEYPMKFTVLGINREQNSLRVKCTSFTGGCSFESTWDDLDITENSFSIGEYKLLNCETEVV